MIVGASGIIGNSLARLLSAKDWEVYALARRPPTDVEGVLPVPADLLDPASLRAALGELRPSHVFLAAWLRQPTEAENIVVNGTMVRNVLEALSPGPPCSTSRWSPGSNTILAPSRRTAKARCRLPHFAKNRRA